MLFYQTKICEFILVENADSLEYIDTMERFNDKIYYITYDYMGLSGITSFSL